MVVLINVSVVCRVVLWLVVGCEQGRRERVVGGGGGETRTTKSTSTTDVFGVPLCWVFGVAESRPRRGLVPKVQEEALPPLKKLRPALAPLLSIQYAHPARVFRCACAIGASQNAGGRSWARGLDLDAARFPNCKKLGGRHNTGPACFVDAQAAMRKICD